MSTLNLGGVEFSESTWPLRTQSGDVARLSRDGHIVATADGTLYFCAPDGTEDKIGCTYMRPEWDDVENEDLPTEADWLKFFADFEEQWER